ncbi:MAG TPA: hypothetical protein VH583_00565 [Vicinamibacterales bacterium]|jgi:hypothetical protein
MVIRHALLYGAALSVVLSVLLFGVLWINPEILLNDYPPDIRKKYGPISERSKRQRVVAAIVIGVVASGIVAASFAAIRADGGGRIPFQTAFVHLFVMFSLFNVVDLVVLDWPLVALRPKFVVLPGTEGSAGYKDYWFHARGFLIGIAFVFAASALMAAVIAALF